MDPLAVIFIPGGLTMAGILFGAPVTALGYLAWRRRARRRIARGQCGRCGKAFPSDSHRYLVTGLTICAPCAHTLRSRLSTVLPTIAVGASVFAVTSATAFVVSMVRNGPQLAWWLDGRWIALVLPSVGIGLLTWGVVSASKRANRLAAERRRVDVDLAAPSA